MAAILSFVYCYYKKKQLPGKEIVLNGTSKPQLEWVTVEGNKTEIIGAKAVNLSSYCREQSQEQKHRKPAIR